MKPEIFIGLGTPKSQLFFDIQALIAENKGRIRLAETLENEWLKGHKKIKHQRRIKYIKYFYRAYEIIFIKENYANMNCRIIAFYLSRSYASIRVKIYKMQQNGELARKPIKKKKKIITLINL